MKSFMCALLFVLLILPACKDPFQIYSFNSFSIFEQVAEDIDANALVIFDIDETIFALTPSLEGEESPLVPVLRSIVPETERSVTNQMLNKIIPLAIESSIVNLIAQLQQRGIKVMALTSGGHGTSNQILNMAEYKIQLLHNLGIHFERSFPAIPEIQFNALGKDYYAPLFYKGVLFSQPSTKGIVLKEFLKMMQLEPILYYFDNDQGYVDEVKQTADAMNLKGAGFVYNGFKNISPAAIQLYNQKLKYLFAYHEWLSDDRAQWLLNAKHLKV